MNTNEHESKYGFDVYSAQRMMHNPAADREAREAALAHLLTNSAWDSPESMATVVLDIVEMDGYGAAYWKDQYFEASYEDSRAQTELRAAQERLSATSAQLDAATAQAMEYLATLDALRATHRRRMDGVREWVAARGEAGDVDNSALRELCDEAGIDMERRVKVERTLIIYATVPLWMSDDDIQSAIEVRNMEVEGDDDEGVVYDEHEWEDVDVTDRN